MDLIVSRILSAKRKGLFRSKPVYRPHQDVSRDQIVAIETELGFRLPDSLKSWLLTAGYGDFDDALSLRSEWINVIDRGELKGHVIFGQDELGEFYSFNPNGGEIHYICRSEPLFARIAPSFSAFLEELEKRDFDIESWKCELSTEPYDWAV